MWCVTLPTRTYIDVREEKRRTTINPRVTAENLTDQSRRVLYIITEKEEEEEFSLFYTRGNGQI